MSQLDIETIEQRTYRLLQIANKNDEGQAIDSDFGGEMFNSLLENTIFKLHCKMIELAIAEEREASGWQPIETAPKDGETAILGYKAITGGLWVTAPMYFTEGTWRIVQFHDDNIEHSMQPSHWQHLPAAPKDEVSE